MFYTANDFAFGTLRWALTTGGLLANATILLAINPCSDREPPWDTSIDPFAPTSLRLREYAICVNHTVHGLSPLNYFLNANRRRRFNKNSALRSNGSCLV